MSKKNELYEDKLYNEILVDCKDVHGSKQTIEVVGIWKYWKKG